MVGMFHNDRLLVELTIEIFHKGLDSRDQIVRCPQQRQHSGAALFGSLETLQGSLSIPS